MSFIKINSIIRNDNKYDIVIQPQIVVAIIKDVITNKFVLVNQYRPGANCDINQFVAGRIDDNETIEEAVIRETLEETGQTVNFIKYLDCWYSSPGITNEVIHSYYIEVLYDKNIKDIDNEINEVVLVDEKTLKDFLADAHSIITYYKYKELIDG